MIFVVAAVALLILLTDGQIVTDVTDALADLTERGERLSHSDVDDRGIVQSSLSELLAQASDALGEDADKDAYILARVIRSEQGNSNPITKARIASVVINQSSSTFFGSILSVVQYHKDAGRNGHFGKQIGGRFSSLQDPYTNDYRIAQFVLENGDQTDGATNFVNRGAFASQEGATSFESFRQTMASEGKLPGIFPADSGSDLVFFWRGSVPSIAVEV